MCTFAYRQIVIDARIKGDEAKAVEVERLSTFKQFLFLRTEHVNYFEFVEEVPRLKDLRRALDETIVFTQDKGAYRLKPDYFHLNETTTIALHSEFNENTQEDNRNRLQHIAHEAGCGWEKDFYFRVVAHIDNRALALCKRGSDQYGDCYDITPRGKDMLKE